MYVISVSQLVIEANGQFWVKVGVCVFVGVGDGVGVESTQQLFVLVNVDSGTNTATLSTK